MEPGSDLPRAGYGHQGHGWCSGHMNMNPEEPNKQRRVTWREGELGHYYDEKWY